MSFYNNQMRIALTGRAGDWLARRAWPHFTMMGAFVLSGLVALLCSHFTASWGGFAFRFGVNFLAGYAAFVLCLGLWLRGKPSLDQSALLEGAPALIETKNPLDDEELENRERLLDATKRSAQDQAQRVENAQGLFGLALAAYIIGAIFVAAYMTWYARWHLGCLLVQGGKVRHRTLEREPVDSWLTSPLRLTLTAGVVLLLHYTLLGLILQWTFPQATTLGDIIRAIRA